MLLCNGVITHFLIFWPNYYIHHRPQNSIALPDPIMVLFLLSWWPLATLQLLYKHFVVEQFFSFLFPSLIFSYLHIHFYDLLLLLHDYFSVSIFEQSPYLFRICDDWNIISDFIHTFIHSLIHAFSLSFFTNLFTIVLSFAHFLCFLVLKYFFHYCFSYLWILLYHSSSLLTYYCVFGLLISISFSNCDCILHQKYLKHTKFQTIRCSG